MAGVNQVDEAKPLLLVNPSYSSYTYPDIDPHHSSELEVEETQTMVAINECEEKFIPFYRKFLVLVGWEPIFEHTDSRCKKFLNWVPIVAVLVCVIFGYIVQAASCLNRDSGSYDQKIATLSPPIPGNASRNSTEAPIRHSPQCLHFIVSRYIIPDLLHLTAYIFSLYVMREKETEHLRILAVRTYRLLSQTNRAAKLRNRLMMGMRLAAILMVSLVLWSLVSSIVSIVGLHASIFFYWGQPSNAGKYTLLTLTLVGFVAFDLVYIAVVMNYCVQCQLMIYYIKGLKENIEHRTFELIESMKKITELKDHLLVLNSKIGIALSLLLFTFASLVILGLTNVRGTSGGHTAIILTSTFMFIIYWATIIIVPVVQALRLSAHCNSLQKIGHRVRVKPFAYQRISEAELDTFLLFTSSLDMKAKIFLVPIQTSYVSLVLTATFFVILILCQTRVIVMW